MNNNKCHLSIPSRPMLKSERCDKQTGNLMDGRVLKLRGRGQNDLVKRIIKEFCPRFTPGGVLVYVGDTGNKQRHLEEGYLQRLESKVRSFPFCEKSIGGRVA